MHANLGDTLHIRAHHIDVPDQWGRIIEIRGPNGTPPYVIEYPDGHTCLMFPGPDALVEPKQPASGPDEVPEGAEHGRRLHTHPGW